MQDMQPELNPEMNQAPDLGQDIATPEGNPVDNEGAMAKADLFKLANYSVKLFKKMDDGQQLESWVQAKITKAADYIASVYHYLEYEMKFSEYGKQLDDSDVLSEGQKAALKSKLVEAKAMVAKIKKDQAAKLSGKKVEEAAEHKDKDSFDANAKTGDTRKTRTGELTKTSTGVTHRRTDFSDEQHGEAPSTVKQKSAAEKKADKAKEIKLPKPQKGTVIRGMKNGEKFEKTVKEGESKKAKKDYDKDGKIESEKDEVIGSRRKAAGLDEAAPSAGMSKKEKSAVVKKAKAGEDLGKPGKGFAKVEKAAKKGGAKDPKAVAAAAMWKQAKKKVSENVEQEVQPEVEAGLEEANMSDQQMMAILNKLRSTPEGQAKLAAALQSSDPEALNKLVGFQLSPGEKTTPAISDPEGVPQHRVKSGVFPSRNAGLNEGTDIDRIKELTKLLG